MNKKPLKTIVTSCVLILAATIYLVDSSQKSRRKSNNTIAPNSKNFSQKKLSSIVAQSKKMRSSLSQKKESLNQQPLTLSEKCQHSDNLISKLSSSEIVQYILDDKISFNSECLEDLPMMLKDFSLDIFNKCQKRLVEKSKDQCESMLFIYKAHVMFKDIDNKSIVDMTTEELVQGFFATMDSPEKQMGVIDELSVRMPDSPFVAKAAILPGVMVAAGAESKEMLIEAINEKLDRAIELNPDDTELVALDMFVAVELSEPDVKNRLRDYSEAHQDSGLGLYYEARLLWSKKDRNGAIQLFQEALAREPDSSAYKQTLAKVQVSPLGDDVFSFRLGFKPDKL